MSACHGNVADNFHMDATLEQQRCGGVAHIMKRKTRR